MSGLLVRLNNQMRDTAGAAIALVALAMVALLSAVALAVDVGMLVTARTEAQVVADGAALEGARVLMRSQGDSAAAHAAAMLAGSTDNTVRGVNVPILEQDVDVIPAEWTVRVRAHRTQPRGNAVPTFFARIFGVNQVNITANGAAWAALSTTYGDNDGPYCDALPLALLDKYEEVNEEPGYQAPPDYVSTGWTPQDHGTLVKLKVQPSQSGDEEGDPVSNEIDYCNDTAVDSSWRCWWRTEDEDPNTENVEEKILSTECTNKVSDEDWLYNAAGNMQSILEAFQELVAMDREMNGPLVWDDNKGCVMKSGGNDCFLGESLLVRQVPVVDPETITGSGQNITGQVIGAMGVFVEDIAAQYDPDPNAQPGPAGQQNVYLRLILEGGTGTAPVDGDNTEEGFIRTLQLIE